MVNSEAISGNRWTEKTARASFPILVWCATHGKAITYGQLDNEVVRRKLGHHVMAVKYGWPAGAIGNALIDLEEEWEEEIPPLNSIVINATTGLPGKGVNYYLEHSLGISMRKIEQLDTKEKRAVVEEVHAKVFEYPDWNAVLAEVGLKQLKGKVDLGSGLEKIAKPGRGGWSGEGESREHDALKRYIAKNPRKVGLRHSQKRGEVEYLFASGDKADVVFRTKTGYLAVEVKSHISKKQDLNRGIFQAVKYQALLRAEQLANGKAPTARGVLVTEGKLPKDLQNLATVLGIGTYVVPLSVSA